MSFIEIVGGNKLYGEINIQGSKNAVLPIPVLNRPTINILSPPKTKYSFGE